MNKSTINSVKIQNRVCFYLFQALIVDEEQMIEEERKEKGSRVNPKNEFLVNHFNSNVNDNRFYIPVITLFNVLLDTYRCSEIEVQSF